MKSFVAIIGLVMIGIGGWFSLSQPAPSESLVANALSASLPVQEEVAREIPAGVKEYHNSQYHFSLLYPDDLTAKEYDEGGGAKTIIFQNIEKGISFQLFVTPYAELQVSEEQFHRDVPSGVRQDPVNTKIDGVFATTFSSQDALYGETKEIWFLKNGFLFELTTLKPLEGLLGEVASTWKFLK